VLDVGCGLGGYVELLQLWGATDAVGVDGFAFNAGYATPGWYRQHDLREPLRLGRKFDLVVCTEVVEHLDRVHERTLMESVRAHAGRLVLFSGARIDQPGAGHVNCRLPGYWLDAWRDAGWEADPFDSSAVRSLATFSWLRRNLLVLKRRGSVLPGAFTARDLVSLEADCLPWPEQAPGVYRYPLMADLQAMEGDIEGGRPG
jgi:SAM-dependent methyltransferase